MSGLFAKFFSSSSNSLPNDVTTMEHLCELINCLGKKEDETGARAAEIARKYRDIFEKRSSDIESFLLHCNPAVGSSAMLSAIKTLFDMSFAKCYEVGTDRAVELLKHYLDGRQLNAKHLRMVPEITFPLLRDIVTYCLEKKNEPRIGEEIAISALRQLFPKEESTKYITSCHAALFACTLRTKNFDVVEDFLNDIPHSFVNENNEESQNCDDPSSSTSSGGPQIEGSSNRARNFEKDLRGKMLLKPNAPTPAAVAPPNPFINPKVVFQYFYYGAMILIEKKNYEKAQILLETCVSIPSYHATDIQIEAYKKYILVSLLINGYVNDINDKSPAVTRLAKTKMNADFRNLLEVRFKRGKNTHKQIETFINLNRQKLEKDENLNLAELICMEMRLKSVISVAKLYSSIKLEDIKELAGLKNDEETMNIIEELVNTQRLQVVFDQPTNSVIWSEYLPEITKQDVEKAEKLIEIQNALLEEKKRMAEIWPKNHCENGFQRR
ncbi:unnamed protein product [Caenorhabditis angaria]|uniref:COP9 signalosome complex subunit 3 n=1 Tax=Caenorhabditis angaria TaxID=860376 RepID=A0A9P1N534_9PELO|nr:unnamed protein product [Caenorhabditis angaria]